MTLFFVSLLAVLIADGTPALADQKPARINVCTVLTREMAAAITAATKTKMNSQPEESPVGSYGSSCDYGGITLLTLSRPPSGRASHLRRVGSRSAVLANRPTFTT